MPLINSEIKLDLNWFKNSIIVTTAVANQGATFSITDTKLSVLVVNLSTEDEYKIAWTINIWF